MDRNQLKEQWKKVPVEEKLDILLEWLSETEDALFTTSMMVIMLGHEMERHAKVECRGLRPAKARYVSEIKTWMEEYIETAGEDPSVHWEGMHDKAD